MMNKDTFCSARTMLPRDCLVTDCELTLIYNMCYSACGNLLVQGEALHICPGALDDVAETQAPRALRSSI